MTSIDDETGGGDNHRHVYDAIIIGAGFSGLCMAIQMIKSDLSNILILEQASSLGGTWRDNTYPGAACDIPSVLYRLFSVHDDLYNGNGNEAYTCQAEILAYQHRIAHQYRLEKVIRYQQHVQQATYDSKTQLWTLQTNNRLNRGTSSLGRRCCFQCHHVISAVGQLHHPWIPEQLRVQSEPFLPPKLHTAQWDDTISLFKKRVGLIGTGATAIQLLPEVAKVASHVEVYQRTAPHVCHKIVGSRRRPWLQRLVRWCPFLQTVYRRVVWMACEGIVGTAIHYPNSWANVLLQGICWWTRYWPLRRQRRRQYHSKYVTEVLQKVTPTTPLGAKRLLFSSDYYPTLALPHVHLTTDPIDHFTESEIVDARGRRVALDVVIFATGFQTRPLLLKDVTVRAVEHVQEGKNDRLATRKMQYDTIEEPTVTRLLHEHWSQRGATAYLGISTFGFPNFHLLYGPNTNLGHNSILFMVEAQAAFILELLQYMKEHQHKECRLATPEIEDDFVNEMDLRMRDLAFSKLDSNVASWYKGENGRIVANWVGGVPEYQQRLRNAGARNDWKGAYLFS